mgnify:CR=1 FL=1
MKNAICIQILYVHLYGLLDFIVVIFILGLVIGLIFCGSYEKKKRNEEVQMQKKKAEKDNLSNKTQMK